MHMTRLQFADRWRLLVVYLVPVSLKGVLSLTLYFLDVSPSH